MKDMITSDVELHPVAQFIFLTFGTTYFSLYFVLLCMSSVVNSGNPDVFFSPGSTSSVDTMKL